MKNLLSVRSREEFRNWLIRNHDHELECWVIVKRGRPNNKNIFWYIDAVEEAMCFGWIDSVTKKSNRWSNCPKIFPKKTQKSMVRVK